MTAKVEIIGTFFDEPAPRAFDVHDKNLFCLTDTIPKDTPGTLVAFTFKNSGETFSFNADLGTPLGRGILRLVVTALSGDSDPAIQRTRDFIQCMIYDGTYAYWEPHEYTVSGSGGSPIIRNGFRALKEITETPAVEKELDDCWDALAPIRQAILAEVQTLAAASLTVRSESALSSHWCEIRQYVETLKLIYIASSPHDYPSSVLPACRRDLQAVFDAALQ